MKSILISDELHKELKIYAANHNRTIREIIETGIRAVTDSKMQSGIARELVIRAKANTKGDMPFE